jgi:hypothetical protein
VAFVKNVGLMDTIVIASKVQCLLLIAPVRPLIVTLQSLKKIVLKFANGRNARFRHAILGSTIAGDSTIHSPELKCGGFPGRVCWVVLNLTFCV